MKRSGLLLVLLVLSFTFSVHAAEPCCTAGVIAKISGADIVVRTAMKQTLHLQLANAQPTGLKPGSRVTVDFAAGVLIAGKQCLPLKEFNLPDMTVAQALGAGEYEIVSRSSVVTVRNVANGKSKTYRRVDKSGPGGVKTPVRTKVTKGNLGSTAPGNCPEGYEERCTVISTGSLASPEDDLVSCHCIMR